MSARAVVHVVVDRLRRAAAAVPAALGESWPRIVAPGVLFLILFPFAVPLIQMELNEPLFGDTCYMQYLAWGIRHGMRLYRDLGSTDGPFIDFMQAAIQTVLGQSDRALRVGDIRLQLLGGALIGAMIAPRLGLNRLARRVSMGVWAAVGMTVWMSYYLLCGWTATANREAFYSVVGCVGMVALYVSPTLSRRASAAAAAAGGFLVTSMCFGKPTGVIFLGTGALALLIAEPEVAGGRRFRIRMALYGAGACVAFFALGLLVFGSFRGYFFWSFELPFIGNRFVWRIDWLRLFLLEDTDGRVIALFATMVGVMAIGWRILPGRALGLVIAPLLHWLSFVAQARGFSHQIMPEYATVHTLALVLAAQLWEMGGQDRSLRVVGPILLLLVGYHALGNFEASPYRWSGDRSRWAKPVETFCDPEKQAGAFLKAHTKPDDTIFAYTVGPRGDNVAIILYWAERRTASPFHYAPWLDPVEILPQSEIQPNAKELAALQALERRTRSEACAAVMRNHPAALVYVSLERMLAICPPVRDMMKKDFYEAKVINDLHIQLRKPGS
jgi:hypothetical protein